MSAVNVTEAALETVPCNLCGAADEREVYAANLPLASQRSDRLRCTDSALGQHGRIVECRGCGLAYTSPREPASAILEAYEGVEDATYLAEEQGRVRTFEGSLRLLHRHQQPPGRLLDVGAYTGLFLSVARQCGWDVVGVEPSRWASEVAQRRYQVSVIPGTTETLQQRDFDAVTMWDVLEHYTDPLAEVRRAAAVLRPGGVLALTTMDRSSLIARLLGPRWWWLMEMHLYYFSRRTVAALLERAGFEVLEIRPHVRIVSLRYLCSRLAAPERGLGRLLASTLASISLDRRCVPVVLGDLMTVMARRKPNQENP